jgi:anti-anti-sigma regulatory factor
MAMTLTKDSTTGALRVSGTLDIDSANALREALLDCFSLQPEVRADLSAVDACDAAGLQVVLAGQNHAALIAKAFYVDAASPPVLEIAAALGFAIPVASDAGSEGPCDAT